MKILSTIATALMLAGLAVPAWSKLPPPSDEAKAKAAEAGAKAAHAGKVGAFQLCKSQDKVAADYMARAKKNGVATKPSVSTPPCADPGAFTPAPMAAAPAAAPAKK